MEIVDGFCFESEKQAAKARKEAGGIKYIKENTRMDGSSKAVQQTDTGQYAYNACWSGIPH